ncbi:MAG: hypothetical protein MPK34_01450 [Gammaproteobacteria bacterium]|nr:hypothetical protein [Gammaproteobacteria bacterium]MDA7961075.1 hypothetical protein [Gammaproteobacteria bacterium]MDA8023204.1 hypothetical protein [Gammaproteobacteria bacterium]
MSTDFLTAEDKEFLDANYNWGLCEDDTTGMRGVVIHDYCLPAGYTPQKTELMLLIPANYPMGNIDMFYFAPRIARADNIGINALADEIHFGIQWQRWSRHYPWEPGVDSIVTHVGFVANQLKLELE